MSERSLLHAVLSLLVPLLGGVVVGAVATVYHAAWIPLGVVASVLVVVLFVAGLRAAMVSRGPATAGAIGVVGSVVALAGFEAGRSVLITANTVGLSFLASVTLATLVILAWPRISPRATGYDEESPRQERTAL